MALTFADTHNMIAFLSKSDASEGFEQIIDLLNASMIQYALTTNDVVRLQALIDRRKVIITEDTVRQVLRLDDGKSIDCLPNKEIFAELARMRLVRNVNSSSKFYMYPRFLKLMINAQIYDISSHSTKYTSPALTQKVFANMRNVGKGFSRVDTPLFDRMLVPQVHDDIDVTDDVANVADVVAADAEPTPPSSTPAITPPPPQQEVASTPPPSPHQSPISYPSSCNFLISAEKFNKEKEKNEKLKEVKARLNIKGYSRTSRYSESRTMNTKEHKKRHRCRLASFQFNFCTYFKHFGDGRIKTTSTLYGYTFSPLVLTLYLESIPSSNPKVVHVYFKISSNLLVERFIHQML
nr:hypothetical protein [Tanacetum cinerariifolium]